MVIKQPFYYPPGKSDRTLHIYLPEGKGGRFPVMYFFDGHNLFFDSDATYGKSWGLKEFLDSWSKPMIVVGMECSHTGNQRLEEYLPYPATGDNAGKLTAKGDETLDWLITRVKPYIDGRFPTIPFRECTGIAGSSMGGLMAIRGVLGYNRWFSKAACLSSAIGFCPEGVFTDAAMAPISANTRVYLSWGSREAWGRQGPENRDDNSQSYRWNHGLAREIDRKGGTTLVYCQPGGGHCEADWEKQVPQFMDFLWMR